MVLHFGRFFFRHSDSNSVALGVTIRLGSYVVVNVPCFFSRDRVSAVIICSVHLLKYSHFEGLSMYRSQIGPAFCLLHASFLLALFFDPEDGDDVILRNVG
jgi:hypothetical protein